MIRNVLFKYPILSFIALGATFFLPFLGGVHLFDWDEVNFAEIAREMVVLKNYLQIHVNFEPFTEKPPGFFWLQAISMLIFGVGEYAARFPNAVFGIITLPSLYFLGNKIKGRTFGVLWALAYFGTILPHLYFKSAIIDPVFNYFIFMGIVYLLFYLWKKNKMEHIHLPKSPFYYLLLAGAFTGFAILAKGPVAYLITSLVLIVYWITVRFKFFIKPIPFLLYSLSTLVVTGIWYGVEYLQNGPTFILEFIERQWTIFSTADAGHSGFPGYHFVVLFFGCFPASAFAIHAMTKKENDDLVSAEFKKWMVILFWVVLILFSIVQSKIVHYSSMAYFPITYLAALSLFKLFQGKWAFNKTHKVILWVTFIPIFIAPLLITFIGMNPEVGKTILSADPFAVANLNAEISWTGWEIIPSIFSLFIMIVAWKYFKTKQTLKGSFVLFGGTALWVFITLVFFIKRVEGFSQRANVEFWKSKAHERCYFMDYKYKTYTHLFYGQVSPDDPIESKDNSFLLWGAIDRPVYISCKIHRQVDLKREVPDAQFLYEKNGFCFYVRQPLKE